MTTVVDVREIRDAVAETGMTVRGTFVNGDGCHVVMIGNVGRTMWQHFRAAEPTGADPLDAWTRAVLGPLANRFGATFVHPNDEPFQPFQQWARQADTVFPSPIGLLIHPEHGLWHAYRGAFVFDTPVSATPAIADDATSPCIDCDDQLCLTSCPVDAFTASGYDVDACAGHLHRGSEPDCRGIGCRARGACPVGVEFTYDTDQMRFHMDAFALARGVT